MRRFGLFLALGGVAAAVNWLSRFAFAQAMPFWAAVIAAYATGMVVAFVLFRRFVFPGSPKPIKQQVAAFCVVNAAGLLQTWLIAMALVGWALPAIGFAWHPEAVGHALAIAAPVATSWIAHRRYTFRPG
jgi:putative flippase GtrA